MIRRAIARAMASPVNAALAIAALVLAALAIRAPAAAEPVQRGAYVARALAAVRGLGADGRAELDRQLYAAARARCRADAGTPAASCLIDAARATCAAAADRPRCEAAADVIVTNLRAATALIDDATRMRLVRTSADYRTALAAELRRRHAVLAAELALAGASGGGGRDGEGGDGDARAIDELCAHRDRELRACEAGDTACVPSLPWSRCVAALVWFVGASPGGNP